MSVYSVCSGMYFMKLINFSDFSSNTRKNKILHQICSAYSLSFSFLVLFCLFRFFNNFSNCHAAVSV